MKYQIVDDDWSYCAANKHYVNSSCFSIRNTLKKGLITKRLENGLWILMISKNELDYKSRLKQFIEYENKWGREVIIDIPGLKESEIDSINRPVFNSKYLVHSTTQESWDKIKDCKKILARFYLQTETRIMSTEIKEYLEKEPAEYKKYIMLSGIDRNNEITMAMYQKGTFSIDKNAQYEPSVRIYLDAQKLLKNGCLTFDGIHSAKIFHEIGTDYIVHVAHPDDFKNVNKWTPEQYFDACNEMVNLV